MSDPKISQCVDVEVMDWASHGSKVMMPGPLLTLSPAPGPSPDGPLGSPHQL